MKKKILFSLLLAFLCLSFLLVANLFHVNLFAVDFCNSAKPMCPQDDNQMYWCIEFILAYCNFATMLNDPTAYLYFTSFITFGNFVFYMAFIWDNNEQSLIIPDQHNSREGDE